MGPEPKEVHDSYGYTWLVVRRTPDDVPALVTDLHAVNSSLESAGFGPALLCSTIGMRTTSEQPVALVYLYKRGTFYPFAPVDADASSVTPRWSCRSALWWRRTCPSRPTSPAGFRSGEPRDSSYPPG